MTLNPKKSPFLCSLLFSWGALLIASFIPFWTAYVRIGYLEFNTGAFPELGTVTVPTIQPMRGMLWTLLRELPNEVGALGAKHILKRHNRDLCIAVGLLVFGAVVGRIVYGHRWEQSPK